MARVSWKTIKRPLMLALGYAFLALGVLGMFLPILQGFLFLFIGLAILARHAAWARLLRRRLVARYPRLGAKMDEAERAAHRWWVRFQGVVRRWWVRSREAWWSFTGETRLRWRRLRVRTNELCRAADVRIQAWTRRVQGFVRR
jgi:uncharacterized protein